ncbi:MAG: cation:proton antiporter [Methanobrevibacter sp.]|uniref:cation:proton antiporter n=1 Tax=Methanobrevibacter sp. TaxID=66852 RepID=UPI0026DFD722|nr:cation:proton antiporter [Methanobrevibacter sp.]MDO5848472.1 cation:proton antiporter [Methanobrevibacter sp.]
MQVLEYLAHVGFNDPVIISLFLIFVLGVGLQWIAQIKEIPGIVLLLPAGMFFGAYLGLINPTTLFGESFYTLVTLGVGFLLFAGGLHLDLSKLKENEKLAIGRLIPINTILCLTVGTLAITYLFSMKWYDALLISSLLVVSGPTVIGPILDYANPNPKLRHIANWEAIITDPLGAVMATIIMYLLIIFRNPNSIMTSTTSPFNSALHLALQHSIFHISVFDDILFGDLVITAVLGIFMGCLLGVLLAAFYIQAKNRGYIQKNYLLLVVWMLVFGGVLLGEILFPESGLFTALVIGIVIANKEKKNAAITKKLNEFAEPIIIGILFIALSSMVNIGQLIDYLIPSLILVALYVIVIRPLTAFLGAYKYDITLKEILFLGFIHPRGIVAAASASLFALKLEAGGIHIPQLVPVVFIVILATVIIYGLFTPVLTRKLGLSMDSPKKSYEDNERSILKTLGLKLNK